MKERMTEMICGNCGNQLPDGVKFCNRCGAAQETAQSFSQSAEKPNTANNYGGAPYAAVFNVRNKQLWLAVMAVIALLGIMSVVCSSLAVKSGRNGVSIPFMSVTALLGNFSSAAGNAAGMVGMLGLDLSDLGESLAGPLAGMIIYTVFAVICIALYALSAILILRKNYMGTVMGMAAGALTILLSVVMIIASFVLNVKLNNPSISLAPAVWTWLAIPIGVLYALLCATKSRELLS